MTVNEFKPIVKKLRTVYTQENFIANEEAFNIWFDMLKDLQAKAVAKAVDNLICESQYPPTIAEIRHEYQRMLDIFNNRLKKVKENYRNAMGGYPSFEWDEDTYNVFLSKIKKIPQNQWESASSQFMSKTIKYVKDCETNGIELPNYKDYINEQSF